jgi:hypothetical protein
MGRPFSDITLYIPTPYSKETPQYLEETSLHNFVSDLYVVKMHGYKPPRATRICIQPGYFGIWDRTWKNGSIFSIACEFLRDRYESLDKQGKYRYILDIIQEAMIQLSNEHHWDNSIFERAYQEVIDCDFIFSIDFPTKMSRDRRKDANIRIQKTETRTFAYAIIKTASSTMKIKLFEKRNNYWYDCIYPLARHSKWIDSDKFGIFFSKGMVETFYSIEEDKVYLLQSGVPVHEIEFAKLFFQF